MKNWTSESVIALISLMVLGAVAWNSKSDVAVGALISMATYNGQKFWELKKLRMGATDAKQNLQ